MVDQSLNVRLIIQYSMNQSINSNLNQLVAKILEWINISRTFQSVNRPEDACVKIFNHWISINQWRLDRLIIGHIQGSKQSMWQTVQNSILCFPVWVLDAAVKDLIYKPNTFNYVDCQGAMSDDMHKFPNSLYVYCKILYVAILWYSHYPWKNST
jgi:hypothetical protein